MRIFREDLRLPLTSTTSSLGPPSSSSKCSVMAQPGPAKCTLGASACLDWLRLRLKSRHLRPVRGTGASPSPRQSQCLRVFSPKASLRSLRLFCRSFPSPEMPSKSEPFHPRRYPLVAASADGRHFCRSSKPPPKELSVALSELPPVLLDCIGSL